ncbi:MAG: saccharopine dehydrogenase, partial [Gammaproteobacteria bacterium]|nr:saccharopine dehydrogenase [Gammaproteobacteria bacterium]
MVVIALGACGEMGRVAAAACVASTATKRVIVADLNSKGAARLAQELGPKAVARAIDINDQAGLVSLLA